MKPLTKYQIQQIDVLIRLGYSKQTALGVIKPLYKELKPLM